MAERYKNFITNSDSKAFNQRTTYPKRDFESNGLKHLMALIIPVTFVVPIILILLMLVRNY